VSTLDRYILREICVPLVVGISLFFVVVTFSQLFQISDVVTGLGISAADLLQALAFTLPPLMGLLLPVSVLFATLLGLGRLTADLEMRGLSAAGVSPYRLLRVPLGLAVLFGVASALCMSFGEPWGVAGLRDLMSRSAQRTLAEGVRPGEFHEWLPGVTFFAADGQGPALTDVLFADLRDQEKPVVLSARRGMVRPGQAARDIVLDVEDGNMVLQDDASHSRVMRFAKSRYRLDVERLVGNKGKTLQPAQGLANAELWQVIHDDTQSGNYRALSTVILHRRFALPLATLIFAALAVPLACRSSANARARGFLYSAAIVGSYYYVGRATELWARGGHFPPTLAAWVPNLVGALGLVFLLWRFKWRAA
jgi:lipopolysaccharide export system permease protein